MFHCRKTLLTNALLQGIENKREMNLCRLGEGVDWMDKSISPIEKKIKPPSDHW